MNGTIAVASPKTGRSRMGFRTGVVGESDGI
jgi:hypothetical protein